MANQKWDGTFKEAYWVDRDNPVEELIENSGRILREPTSDGYTHDIVYRAGYISEDYYFPNLARSNGHDHYELHSNGNIMINGKRITMGGKKMKRLRMRALTKIDGTKLNNEASENIKRGEQLDELGKDYLSDKAQLEQQYEEIANDPTLDPSHKKEMLRDLKDSIKKNEQDYEKNVTEEQEAVQENLRSINDDLQAGEMAAEAHESSLRKVKLDAKATDTSAAVGAAEAEKEKFREWHAQNVEALNLRIEQQQAQRREMLRNNLSGR